MTNITIIITIIIAGITLIHNYVTMIHCYYFYIIKNHNIIITVLLWKLKFDMCKYVVL